MAAKVSLINLQDPLNLLGFGPRCKEKRILCPVYGKNVRAAPHGPVEKSREIWSVINTRTAQVNGVYFVAIRNRVDVEIWKAKFDEAPHPVSVLVVWHEQVPGLRNGGVLGQSLDGRDESWFQRCHLVGLAARII